MVVAPLETARGIQNKILEAMAMAKPVVASSVAADGITAEAEIHFYVEDGSKAQAERVNALLCDVGAMLRVGASARAHVEAHYGWQQQLRPLAEMMRGDLGRREVPTL